MININSVKKNDILYLIKPTVVYQEKDYEYKTKPYHKCIVFNTWESDCINIDIEINGEIFCRSYLKNEESNSLFISEFDYKKMKMTEKKIWKSLQKNLNNIDLLDNPSTEMLQIKSLILNSLKITSN